MSQLILKDEAYAIIGACFEVHNQLGAGFLEAVYQEALELELAEKGIPFVSQLETPIIYRGRQLTHTYRADIVCFDQIIVEIKAAKRLDDVHRAQLINYLKATGLPLGLLVNFGASPAIEHERFANTK